jgi:hypothetical protein
MDVLELLVHDRGLARLIDVSGEGPNLVLAEQPVAPKARRTVDARSLGDVLRLERPVGNDGDGAGGLRQTRGYLHHRSCGQRIGSGGRGAANEQQWKDPGS